MKKRVISWLLCLALCLSMLPMAALAEDVQAPEGPAPSMNEPQPEPRAKENETPTPEPEKKVQPELMTAGNLLMPLTLGDENSPFSSISIVVLQNSTEIGDDNQGILNKSVTLYGELICKDADQRAAIIKNSTISLIVDDKDFTSGSGGTTKPSEILVNARDLTPVKEKYTITLSITYGEYSEKITRDLTFKKCPHPDIKNENKCAECGAALVAELTAGASSSATTYYDALKDALDAAQEADAGSTVTLLADCSLDSYELRKGSFMLDLDGHTLTQPGNPLWVSGTANLTVKNNNSGAINCGRFCVKSKTATLSVTIGSKYKGLMTTIAWQNVSDFLDSDMGYQINRKWADALAIRSMSIENVTVAKAPFTTSDITVSPENAYVNREATLSVTLSEFQAGQAGTEATCEYSVRYGTNYAYQKSLKNPTYRADQAFAVEFTPSEEKYYIQAVITSGEFSVVKTLEKTFKTCMHRHGEVNQNTGYCKGCDSWMAASVSSTHYVDGRKYYETFDLAMNAALEMLKSKDCWFTMFQDAQVGTIEYQYLGDLSGKTLYMDLNKKTLTSRGVAFRVQGDKWKLDITNGTVIGDTSGYKPVNGVIEVEAGGYLNVRDGTIQNKGANAPSIMVHGYSPSTGAEVRGVANIAGDEKSNFGSLFINGGNVTVNGGTYDHAKVTNGGSLKVFSGTFQGDVTVGGVTVDDHALLAVGSKSAYFDGKLTFEPYGSGMLTNGNYKHIITKGATLGKLSNNTLDVFYIGEVYQPDAKNQAELKAGEDTYITIRKHKHDFSNGGTCACGEEAEAYLSVDGQRSYGYFDKMLALAEENNGSCVYLLKDVTIIRDTEVKKGNFSIAGGSFKVTCSGPYALVFGGGTVSISDGTFDRLKVKDTGKLTLNGGKYYAIDVTDSTYENYGQLLPDGYAFKTSTTWESKSSITDKSFDVTSTNAPKSVEKPPFDSVSVIPAITTANYGKPMTFTATVTRDDSSKALSYQWYTVAIDGTKTAIEGATGATLTVNEAVGTYQYLCQVTCEDYTLSSNTVQLTVQRIGLSDAALSATIQTRAYDGSASATVTASSIGNSSLTAGTDYTISAEFEDANAGKGKKVTVKVTLTNRNYCFDYDANKRPIMEKTFKTTGTIIQNTTPIEKSEKIEVYSGIAHTYTIDLDACLSNLQNLGFESYEITEKNIVVAKLIDANQVVLEGHSLKIPVNAVITAPSTEAAQFTITVTCKNYSDVTIRVRVVTKDRLQVTATATPSKTELTYGEKLDTIALSGTTDPMIPGTFAWQTPDAILDAGRHADLVWKFIPADYTYAEASGTAEITVKQAKLTDPAPVTLTIYNGWAGTYEAAFPALPALAEGLRFGNDAAAYGPPDVSADGYYSSGATLKMVGGKQGVSIPILKNETTKEGQVGTITVQYTSQNYKPVTLAINLVAKNRTAPTFILTADHDTLSGGGKVTLTLERGNLPDGAGVTVSGTDEAGNAVTLTDNGDGTYSATLPNKTQTYTFIAAYDGSQTIAPKTGFTTVKVQQRSSGGGEPAKPSFPVKISNSGDGVAKVDKSYASAGDKVTITVTPGRNATVQHITVTDEDGERLKLTENRDGTYSFTMPNGAANVYARFSGSGLPFADVPSGSWYYDDVAYVYDTGLMTGLTATTFGPNLSTTRGMIVTILWRMENEPAAKHGCPFADVRRGSYYEQAIAWASENGIVTGFDASTFAPDRAITREQLAAILFRFAAYRGMDAVTLRENLSSFQDQAAISAYAVSALNWAVGEGLMQGTGDKLEPTGNATRAQVAAMLRRFMQRNF